jgi:phosphoribosylamine-glycine ligase
MKVLLVGGGGREHALAWKLARIPRLRALVAAPGNPGIATHADCVPVKDAAVDEIGPERTLLPISGVDEAGRLSGVTVFHAGTALRDGQLVTAGGRVLGLQAVGRDLRTALAQAYAAVARIAFAGMHYRRDTARRAVARR